MFLGTYSHTLDERNRMSVPKKYRDVLTNKCIVSQGLDGCLYLFTESGFNTWSQSLINLPNNKKDVRTTIRNLIGSAFDIEIDNVGRILLPKELMDHAQLSKDVIVVGVINKIEIWDKKAFMKQQKDNKNKTEEFLENLETK